MHRLSWSSQERHTPQLEDEREGEAGERKREGKGEWKGRRDEKRGEEGERREKRGKERGGEAEKRERGGEEKGKERAKEKAAEGKG